MTTGLILLVFIAMLAALGWTRLSGRLGIAVSWRTWLTFAAVFALAVLVLWAYSTSR